MASDIKLNDDDIIIEGSQVTVQGSLKVAGPQVTLSGKLGVGTESPMRGLHVHGGEVHSGGPSAGYSFAARNKGDSNFAEGLAERWVLYSDGRTARLWVSPIGDVFSVGWNGQAFVGGSAAGYSFCDQDGPHKFEDRPKNGERWTWYAKEKAARLLSGTDLLTVQLDGKVGIGTNKPLGQLHVQGGEVHSGGEGAGYSFADRAVNSFEANPGKGQRWVWYANNKEARLWSGTDKLRVTPSGMVHVSGITLSGTLHSGNMMLTNGKILVPTGNMMQLPSAGTGNPMLDNLSMPETIDLVATVIELRKTVGELKAALKKK